MHIVHVGISAYPPVLYPWGGAIQRRIFEIAREQVCLGDHVVVYSVGDKTEVRMVSGVEVRYLRCKSNLPWRHLEFQTRVIASLLKDQAVTPTIIHFHSQPEGAILTKFIPAKKFLSYDNFYFRGGRKTSLYYLYQYFLKNFNLLLPCSSYCLQESSNYWDIPINTMRVLYNGVNIKQFRPNASLKESEKYKLGIEKRVVLYLGRLCRQKGTDVLLNAYRILTKKRNDVQLVVVGPVSEFGNKSGSNTWPESIRQVGGLYLDPVEDSRLAAIYNLADIFVMPTRELEMFGMAAIEAQACGKPVVASDLGGLKETVPETCGARFPTGDSEKLAEKINMLLSDASLYARCSANAIQNATTYDWSNICTVLNDIYKRT